MDVIALRPLLNLRDVTLSCVPSTMETFERAGTLEGDQALVLLVRPVRGIVQDRVAEADPAAETAESKGAVF